MHRYDATIHHIAQAHLSKPQTYKWLVQFAEIMSNLSNITDIYCIYCGVFDIFSQQDSAEAWQILKIADTDTQPRYASLASRQVMPCTDLGHTMQI